MRRILSAEHHVDNLNGTNLALLSEEEAAVMVDEANADNAEAEAGLDEAKRVLDTVDSLEDMADIVEANGETQGDELTQAESNLVDAAASASVAGDDSDPEEIVPAMESFVGQPRRLAVETIREKAASLWKTVVEYLKKIWAKIEGFFYKFIGEVPMLRRKVAGLKKRIEDAGTKSIKKDGQTFKVSSGLTAMQVDNSVIKTVGELKSAMEATQEAATFVFSDLAGRVAAAGEAVAKGVAEFDVTKAEQAATTVLDALTKDNLKIPGQGGSEDRFSGYICRVGKGLFSNRSLAVRFWKDGSDTSVVGRLNRTRHNGVIMVPTKEKANELPSDVAFKTMSSAEMSATLRQVEKLLDTVEEWRRGSKLKKVLEVRKTLETASNKATKAAEKLESAENADRGATAIYRELINMNYGYANWAKEPAAGMVTVALQGCRTAMMLVARSCDQYGKD